MSRFGPNPSYGHWCKRVEHRFGTWYEIGWTVDRYYGTDVLRYPIASARQTDEAGARRFCKKWGIEFPEEKEAQT